ncbi:hypothetical protein [Legionella genomosp. 1]|uniref:hypothetical protein n=1 Tax=Legionella genomosp. 1 TaxID=1093625 RepID=UPI0010541FE7|nr:hypothetical protein [Legionella genomosp. 1]
MDNLHYYPAGGTSCIATLTLTFSIALYIDKAVLKCRAHLKTFEAINQKTTVRVVFGQLLKGALSRIPKSLLSNYSHLIQRYGKYHNPLILLVGVTGIEPATPASRRQFK